MATRPKTIDSTDAVDLLDRAVACIDKARRQQGNYADPNDPTWSADSVRLDWAIESVDDVTRRWLSRVNRADDSSS